MASGRIRTDVSYYDKKSYDQIFSVPSSPSTGYTSITRNAGDLRNKGLEVTVISTPVQTPDFDWDLRLNYTKNKSSVIELAPGVPNISLAGYSWPQIRIMEGYPYGVIWGYGYARNNPTDPDDPNSCPSPAAGCNNQLLMGDDGWPLLDDQLKVLGNIQPEWNGNLNSSIRYKAVSLSALVDTRQGGDMLNFDIQYTVGQGQHKMTENRGDIYMFKGVNATTGEPNTIQLERNETFWRRFGAYDMHENQVEPADNVRLREVSLGLLVPQRFTQRLGARSMTVNLSGRNLKVWTPNSKGDPEGSNYGSSNAGGQAFSFFQSPQTRSWTVGVRAAF